MANISIIPKSFFVFFNIPPSLYIHLHEATDPFSIIIE